MAVCTYPDQSKYEGDWKDGMYDGLGCKTLEDGTKFQGMFVDGKEKGHGKKILANGTVFEGTWDGEKFIKGKVNYTDGQTYEG